MLILVAEFLYRKSLFDQVDGTIEAIVKNLILIVILDYFIFGLDNPKNTYLPSLLMQGILQNSYLCCFSPILSKERLSLKALLFEGIG